MDRSTSLTGKIFRRLLIGFFLDVISALIALTVDTLFISRCLGNDATAAMILFLPCVYIYKLPTNLLVGGVGVIGSALLGKMQLKEAGRTYSLAGTWGMLLALLFAGLTFALIDPMTGLFCGTAPASVCAEFRAYTLAYAPSLPAMFLSAFLFPLLQLDGESKRCQIAVAASTVANILGDFLCVSVFRLGMAGIAIATVASQYLSTVIMGIPFLRGRSQIRLSPVLKGRKEIRGILVSGLPAACTYISCFLFQLLYNRLILKYGGVAGTAAMGIHSNIIAPFKGLGLAIAPTVTAIMGVYQGEEDIAGIRSFLRMNVRYFIAVLLPASVVLFFTAPALVSLFNAGEAAAPAVFLTRCYAIALCLHSGAFFIRGYLPAVGAHTLAIINTCLAEVVCPLLTAALFASRLGFDGIGYALPVGYLCYLLLAVIGYRLVRRVRPEKRLAGFRAADFGVTEIGPEATVQSIGEVVAFSRSAYDFCRERVGVRKAYRISLAAEELGTNIFEHAAKVGKKAPGAELRVRIKKDTAILSLRDTGRLFDPKAWNEKAAGTGTDRGIGIRLALTGAEVEYVNTFGLNMIMIRL